MTGDPTRIGAHTRAHLRALLVEHFELIADIDPSNPDGSGQLVMTAVALAAEIGYPAGYATDPEQPGLIVAYVDLPTGQVSWHLPVFCAEFDQHSTTVKYDRLRQYISSAERDDL